MHIPRLKAGGRAFAHIAQFYPELVALRRDLHAHPELGFEEVYTSARVKEALKLCGVDEVHDGIGRTGVVGVIRGRSTAAGGPMFPPTTRSRPSGTTRASRQARRRPGSWPFRNC